MNSSISMGLMGDPKAPEDNQRQHSRGMSGLRVWQRTTRRIYDSQ